MERREKENWRAKQAERGRGRKKGGGACRLVTHTAISRKAVGVKCALDNPER